MTRSSLDYDSDAAISSDFVEHMTPDVKLAVLKTGYRMLVKRKHCRDI